MRQITPAALSALMSAQPPYVKRATLQRRLWNGSAYELGAGQDITADMAECGRINFKLDAEGYNVWSLSNCALTVRNERNQWKEGNPEGYFPDGTSAAMSRIVIEAGVLLEDGSAELSPVFCGYISDGITLLPDERKAQFTVISPMSRLDLSPAQDAAQFTENEAAGSDSGTEFTTQNPGVGSMDRVLRGQTADGPENAQELMPGADFSVSQLSQYELGAKITLAQPLSSGQSLWVSYRRWLRDKTVEQTVNALLDLAGVSARQVEAPQFSYGIRNIFPQSGQEQFSEGGFWQTMWYAGGGGVSLLYNSFAMQWYTPGTYTSPVIDGGADLLRWGRFGASRQVPAGTTSSFSIRDSADGQNWSGWSDISPGAAIAAGGRYIQLRWNAACQLNPPSQTPVLLSWSAEYFTSRVTISLADMSGLSCRAALEELAKISCCECGFDAAETFIFRPRGEGGPPLAALDENAVVSADNMSSGAERVYNRIVVAFGGYSRTADCESQNDAAPSSQQRCGTRTYEISGGNFLPADNVDLAYAVAPAVWNYCSRARRRITVKCRFLHHLELGDAVSLSLPDNAVLRAWRWGDAGAAYGMAQLRWHGDGFAAARLCAWKSLFRVEGIIHDLENFSTELDLTEVL
ncbi:MAG: hypothetical protein WC421_03525 [Elusimicrobiales bacterium]